MTYLILTHDAWGVVTVGDFTGLDEARQAFAALCQDPWYRQDGTVRALELVMHGPAGDVQRLDWFPFQELLLSDPERCPSTWWKPEEMRGQP
ncbi:MAG: hypothetical protein RLZZ611_807 [Cyanobacteriota bacterium]|jgi:hypothetical protein